MLNCPHFQLSCDSPDKALNSDGLPTSSSYSVVLLTGVSGGLITNSFTTEAAILYLIGFLR